MEVDQVLCKDPVQRSDIALHIGCEAFLFKVPDIPGGVGKHPPGTYQ
jgi:hypothetical protein